MIPLDKMKSPGAYRPGIWRGRVLQVKWLNACDLSCANCSVGVGLAKKLKKVFIMPPKEFRRALQSLKGFPGVIGAFGGNPTLHPSFEEMCAIFREEIPNIEQRGLWSNRLHGHGSTCRKTFYGPHSNLNVHQSQEAWDEIKRDWPEAIPLEAGLSAPSHHGPIFGSQLDLGITPKAMWESVGSCYVNQTWSAEITMVEDELKCFFCEIAATQAELLGNPKLGMEVSPGWWAQGMDAFASQVRFHCRRCLIPLNARKIDAAGAEPEEYTKAWAPTMLSIKGRPLRQITLLAEIEGGEPATKYLPRGVGDFK